MATSPWSSKRPTTIGRASGPDPQGLASLGLASLGLASLGLDPPLRLAQKAAPLLSRASS
ncbi:MAG: hypothetical protein JOZ72_14945 [Alphaproteobacteria bacterium]|nr:hypothetical protein [Alphaproteobacteria bacterium]